MPNTCWFISSLFPIRFPLKPESPLKPVDALWQICNTYSPASLTTLKGVFSFLLSYINRRISVERWRWILSIMKLVSCSHSAGQKLKIVKSARNLLKFCVCLLLAKGFVSQYYALFDDPNQRNTLVNFYNVSSVFEASFCGYNLSQRTLNSCSDDSYARWPLLKSSSLHGN